MDDTIHALRQRLPGCRLVLLDAAALEHQGLLRRRTLDLDLMVVAGLEEVVAALADWKHPAPHRWVLPSGMPVDLLPVEAADIERGFLSFERGVEMNLAGFELLLDRRGTVPAERLAIELASPAAIFVLKIIAWNDRPTARSKDLADLAAIMEDYLPRDDDRRYIGPPTEQGWYQEEAATWWLGHDVARLCDAGLLETVRTFVERLRDDEVLAGLVAARAPESWSQSTEAVGLRAGIVLAGMDQVI